MGLGQKRDGGYGTIGSGEEDEGGWKEGDREEMEGTFEGRN